MDFQSRNYQLMAHRVYQALHEVGYNTDSRNGPVRRLPGVTTMTVLCPWERVNTSPVRDCNPFFHLIESMAMLAGMNDVKFLSYFAKNMANFSDDGETFNAFYGTRLRTTWGDQFDAIINELKSNPDSRQCVAQIWDPADLGKNTKDKACNTQLMFSVSPGGRLEMTSINRSNDAIWGMVTGANVVHLSYFQEYVACGLGRVVGPWTHVSNNLHVYTDEKYQGGMWDKMLREPPISADMGYIPVGPSLFSRPGKRPQFDRSLQWMLLKMKEAVDSGKPLALENTTAEHYLFSQLPFLGRTVIPVFNAWHFRKLGDHEASQRWADLIQSGDWKSACLNWLARRKEATK